MNSFKFVLIKVISHSYTCFIKTCTDILIISIFYEHKGNIDYYQNNFLLKTQISQNVTDYKCQ